MSALALSLAAVAVLAAAPPTVPGPATIDDGGGPQPIYGGELVAPDGWQAVVAVRTNKLCTGTLVAPNLVLTAAHCFDPAPVGDVTITFGNELGTEPAIVAEAWGSHPEFCYPSDCGEDIYDFAWVRLPAPADVTPIVPITDQAELDEVMTPGTALTFVGFGADELGATGFKREVGATLTGVNDSGREFRAGGDGKDTCLGDSGGPAIVELASGELRLAGVLSRGGDCGEGGVYGLPFPELCWLRDDSGVNLLPPGCDSCECLALRPEDEGCACVASPAPLARARPWWLLAEFGLLALVGLGLRRRRLAPS